MKIWHTHEEQPEKGTFVVELGIFGELYDYGTFTERDRIMENHTWAYLNDLIKATKK